MTYIKGKVSKIIYTNEENNFCVILFKVHETDDKKIKESINKTITASGIISDPKEGAKYELKGSYEKHPKYSYQFVIKEVILLIPTQKEEIISFLSSPFIEGCTKKMAEKIVDTFGTNTINIIIEDYNRLLEIKGMTLLKTMKIYNSLINYQRNNIYADKLKELGFTYDEASKIINKHMFDIDEILNGNLYILKDIFDFKKLDELYKLKFDSYNEIRIKECLIQSMMQISFNEGSTYYIKDDIFRALSVLYQINLSSEEFDIYLDALIKENIVIKENNFYFLTKYYEEENMIAKKLFQISIVKSNRITKLEDNLKLVQKEVNITYNDEQLRAIKNSLLENISIISGGPGTGKTTIINAIVKTYLKAMNIDYKDASKYIALLAPTGRASKKMSASVGLPAYTIHRFLGWHKEEDYFEYNEENKVCQKLIIVDESSMLDVSLMYSLLIALYDNVKIIFVGDIYQLPSVGPGLVLQDMINSDLFSFNMLNTIYRQSDNSYIPYLAKDIKNFNVDDEYMYKRDDYNFIVCEENQIISSIASTVKIALEKGLNEDNLQVLCPIYKGENGIDNINLKLRDIFNPKDGQIEIKYGDKIYRENDKVLQLVNDSDNNIFNGDIGKIIDIYHEDKKEKIAIDFEGNIVSIYKKDLKNITHAYAISVHKAQGSEFEHVIMPLCNKYFIMLYNKLLYTAVSRAKKSLTLIGDPRSYIKAITTDYALNRKTTLQERITSNFSA